MSRKTILFVVTIVASLIVWLLFELIRFPYRPPEDMTTLLGREKFAVIALMVLVSFGWLFFLVAFLVTCHLTRAEYISFAKLLGIIGIIAGLLVFCPCWPATPFHLILK